MGDRTAIAWHPDTYYRVTRAPTPARRLACPPRRPGRGPNGRAFCRWCGTEVPKGRQTWCSDQCVTDYRVRSDPGFARAQVLKRDRGVCAECGLDTVVLEREIGGRQDLRRQACLPGVPQVPGPLGRGLSRGRVDPLALGGRPHRPRQGWWGRL